MASKKQQQEDVVVQQDLAPDPFLERANAYAGAVEKNLRIILVVGGLALAGGVISLFVGRSSERSASARTLELSKAIEAYNEAVDPSKTFTATVTAVVVKQAQDAMPKFDGLVSGKDAVADLSKLYLADLARRAQDHAKAETLYREYLKAAGPKDPLRFTATEGLGYALEAQGKLDEALAELTKLADIGDKAFADLALTHQARIKEAKGDKAGAAELYRALLDKHAESKYRDLAEQRLATLE